MRYSSALVLGALAAGQATAAHSNRHASFHARRHEEAKRDLNDVDWSSVSYDLSGISDAEWSSILNSQQPAATSVAAAAPSSAAPAVTSSPVVQAAAQTTEAATPSSITEKAAAASGASSGGDDDLLDDLSSLLGDITKFVTGLGALVGKNEESDNGNAWLGDDGKWKLKFQNNGQTTYVFCWSAANAWINVAQPWISIPLKAGESQTVSFAEGFSGACSTKDSGSLRDGLIPNTWAEFTFDNTYGTYDVSREVLSDGTNFSMKGSKCTSNMDTCVFKCGNGEASCITGYVLENCSAGNGGGSGVDYAGNGGASGGCMMAQGGETIDVTIG